jgi:hypothetical protein
MAYAPAATGSTVLAARSDRNAAIAAADRSGDEMIGAHIHLLANEPR